jgi:hypothetical protein
MPRRSIEMNAYQFFLKHAGYAYDPKTETAQQGRIKCARQLAQAERDARDGGFSYNWSVDEISSQEEGKTMWQCGMYNENGRIVNSLHGIDLGENTPWSDPYRRVVEAELALDGLTNEPQ